MEYKFSKINSSAADTKLKLGILMADNSRSRTEYAGQASTSCIFYTQADW
jgi:hypothetical protein